MYVMRRREHGLASEGYQGEDAQVSIEHSDVTIERLRRCKHGFDLHRLMQDSAVIHH
jgi:hypothetical protein